MRCGGCALGMGCESVSSIESTKRKRQAPSDKVKLVPRISMSLSLHALPLSDGEHTVDESEYREDGQGARVERCHRLTVDRNGEPEMKIRKRIDPRQCRRNVVHQQRERAGAQVRIG